MYKLIAISCLAAGMAAADTLETASERLENVYVRETQSRYYAADPESGMVHSFAKAEAEVTRSQDRQQLLEAWRARSALEKDASRVAGSLDDYPRYGREPKPLVLKGSATYEKRHRPGQDVLAYQEYLRNGYRAESDAQRRNQGVYAPSIETLKLQDHLSTRPVRTAAYSPGFLISGRPFDYGLDYDCWPYFHRRPLVYQYLNPIILQGRDGDRDRDRDRGHHRPPLHHGGDYDRTDDEE